MVELRAGDCIELTVAPEQAGTRLDIFLTQAGLPHTRSQIKRIIDQGLCQVNARVVRGAKRLAAGDRILFRSPTPEPLDLIPEALPLVVLYEDDQLIVLDKPAGMVVHPAPGHYRGTLVAALLAHCTHLSGVGGKLRPGIVHRLDKGTSGVLVASKSDAAHQGLSLQFKAHTVERAYQAVVAGWLSPAVGVMTTPHRRHPRDRKRFTGRAGGERQAVTHYRVLRKLCGATLVEARLETGRTHQVRMHFAEAGHGVLGDPLYGRQPRDPRLKEAALTIGRQALHAAVLGFSHPLSGERLRFTTALPEDMVALIQFLSGIRAMADEFVLEQGGAGLSVLRCPGLNHPSLCHAFTTRQIAGSEALLTFGGSASPADVEASMGRLEEGLAVARQRFFRPKQVHGNGVLRIGKRSDAAVVRGQEADAVVTSLPGTTLAVATADCVPVLLWDPEGIIGAAHAGWRGAALGVLEQTLATMAELGGDPRRVHAAIGPAISAQAYEVGEEVAEAFSSFHQAVTRSPHRGRFQLDLPLAVQQIVERGGVPPSQIARSRLCTFQREDLFFSFRREGERAGRQLALIRLNPD